MKETPQSIRTVCTGRKVKKFLAILAETANVRAACRDSGIPRQNIYEWRKRNQEFAQQMDAAVELGTAALEDEAVRRGMEGWEEPVYYKGEEVGSIRRYSDQLLITCLKARNPAKYREGIEDGARGSFVLNVNIVNTDRIEAPATLEEIVVETPVIEVVTDGGNQQDDTGVSEAGAIS